MSLYRMSVWKVKKGLARYTIKIFHFPKVHKFSQFVLVFMRLDKMYLHDTKIMQTCTPNFRQDMLKSIIIMLADYAAAFIYFVSLPVPMGGQEVNKDIKEEL